MRRLRINQLASSRKRLTNKKTKNSISMEHAIGAMKRHRLIIIINS
jgi:hypothetical protein